MEPKMNSQGAESTEEKKCCAKDLTGSQGRPRDLPVVGSFLAAQAKREIGG